MTGLSEGVVTRLRLTLQRFPDFARREIREIETACIIGRDVDAGWCLPDPHKVVSRRHCELRPTVSGWLVTDLSENGTFVNSEPTRIGRGRSVSLQDGDVLRLGEYEIEARLEVPSVADPAPSVSMGEPPPRPAPGQDVWTPVGPGARGGRGKTVWDDLDKPLPPEPPPQPPPPAPVPPLPPDALLAAFLRGAGLAETNVGDAARMLERAGQALRAMVAGLRDLRFSRSTVKSEFRITESFVHSPSVGNPLRLILDERLALRGLLDGEHPAEDSVSEALERVRLHELALLAAMRSAVDRLLAELGPARVTAELDQAGWLSNLPVQRELRAWEKYRQLHARKTQTMTDDFDSTFGRDFAREYEKIVQAPDAPAGRGRR